KFDDGQEFFGTTYCPGDPPNPCWGLYPRTQDYSFITNDMPSWVRPPGDSPFVAAYPVIDFLVDYVTVHVVAKEIYTVERTITQGEEISTGFAETTGQSTTVGTIDTNTHSTWQENSTTEGGIEPATFLRTTEPSVYSFEQYSGATSFETLQPQVTSATSQTISGLCWGVTDTQTAGKGLSGSELEICNAILSATLEGDQLSVSENTLLVPEEHELLIVSISEYEMKPDQRVGAWIEGYIRNKDHNSPDLYTEMYAILEHNSQSWTPHFAGSRDFNGLLAEVPEAYVASELKSRLAQWSDPEPQPPDTHFYLPYTKGESLNVYVQPPHGGTWAWDFQTAESGTTLRASRPGYVYAYDGHTQSGCDSSLYNYANWVLIDHDDGTASLYLHIRANGALRGKQGSGWGEWVTQGTPVAISGNTGYSYPCPGGVHHLHFQVQAWQGAPQWVSSENRFRGVFNYDSYRVRFEE
ncbi:M23 family metallopeptidase, partial [Candidatus Saccharibacteria bacterium]|nr:M23 family metallopeptidase [Candidatus Saccharibacteria bacterium]